MPRALIIGASGFVGPYLARHLNKLGYKVWGASLSGQASEEYQAIRLDVRSSQEVLRLMQDLNPDEIYHLAGISRPALGLVSEFYEVNLMGAINVMEAAKEIGAKVLLVSSAYVYGKHDTAITEDMQLRPLNHYGVSKAGADLAAIGYARDDLRVVRARPFNHSGPGQSPDFLLPTLVQQLARIEAGLAEPVIKLGNLDSVRDFSDVRDVVRAYRLLLEQGENGAAYNVGSGRGISVKELADKLLATTNALVQLEVEEARARSTDIPCLVADPALIFKDTGWQASIPLDVTVKDMLEHERTKY